MTLGKKTTTGLIATAVLLTSITALPTSRALAEPVAASEGSSSSGSPQSSSTLLACLPDPLDINSGDRDFGDVVQDAFEHSPFGRLKALVSGEEQADFAPPHLKLLPGEECFGSGDENADEANETND